MGKIKIQPITNDLTVLKKTIVGMMYVEPIKALDLGVLTDAMTRLPFNTELVYNKIYGYWIYTSQHEDEWSKLPLLPFRTCGPDFTFIESCPEMAIIKGIHYYYHTRIKD